MTVVDAPVRLGISLGIADHPIDSDCVAFGTPLFKQMSSGKYDECATMPLPRTVEAWEAEHRTARKRAWRAQGMGYGVGRLEREDWERDIDAIHASAPYRQGRPMSAAYQQPSIFEPLPDYPCPLHAVRITGVWDSDYHLVAYLVMMRAGDLALVSQVLGHADHEPNGIMYLLFRVALAVEGAIAPGVCVYNRWDSGTDGLRFLKARIGFEPTAVEWLP